MAKQVTVVDLGVAGGVQVNPKDSVTGGTRWTVPYAKALKAAQGTGIDVYVNRLKAGKTLRMKPNNKALVPFLRSFRPSTDTQVQEQPKAARKTRKTSRKATQQVELTLEQARDHAKATGDWSKVEAILDRKFA
jgi:hypothetical protein